MLLFNGGRFNQLNTFGAQRAVTPIPVGQIELYAPLYRNRMSFGYASSWPKGYQSVTRAIWPVFFSNEVKVVWRPRSEASMAVNLMCVVKAQTAMVGEATAVWDPYAGARIQTDMVGDSSMSVDAGSVVKVQVAMSAAASPTAEEIASITVQSVIESGLDLREVLRILLAVAANKTEINDLGGGVAVVKFKDRSGTKDRIVATMEESTRADVQVDPS